LAVPLGHWIFRVGYWIFSSKFLSLIAMGSAVPADRMDDFSSTGIMAKRIY